VGDWSTLVWKKSETNSFSYIIEINHNKITNWKNNV